MSKADSLNAQTEVLICGGGPVGLALAVELGTQGVPCILVERRTQPSRQPRAKLANVRTMELMRRWGLADALRKAAPLPPDFPSDVAFVTRLLGRELARFPNALSTARRAEDPFPEPAQQVPQFVVEQILRDRARRLPNVDLRFGVALERFESAGERVLCHLHDGVNATTVEATWLAACDGSRSRARESLGIELLGETLPTQNVGLVLDAPGLWQRVPHGRAVHYWMVNEQAPSIMGPYDAHDLWFFQATGIPSELDAESIDPHELLIDAVGGEFDYTLIANDPWRTGALLASRYREDRVFVLGDAAHIHPPMGGYGMNMGIGDAVDLGWKLGAVHNGWGADALLDSYELERRPVHQRVIEEAASNYRLGSAELVLPGLEDDGEFGDRQRAIVAERILTEKAKEFRSIGVQLGYRYEDSPCISPDGTGEPPNPVGSYEPTARPGHRAPHAWLGDDDALYDRFGHGVTLVALDEDADTAPFTRAAQDRNVPLRLLRLPDPALRELYGAQLVLVRPDWHVAWRSTSEIGAEEALDRLRGVSLTREIVA